MDVWFFWFGFCWLPMGNCHSKIDQIDKKKRIRIRKIIEKTTTTLNLQNKFSNQKKKLQKSGLILNELID